MTRAEWLQWRKEGIGASDAPIIMNVSEHKTPLELYQEKLPETPVEEEGNFITDRGNRIEPRVRSLVEIYLEKTFEPKLVVMDKFPFIRASLDGWSPDRCDVLEIKMLGREDWDKAKRGIIPDKHIPQVQHQLMVTSSARCVYAGYLYNKDQNAPLTLDGLALVFVPPNHSYWETLLTEEIKFWDCVTKRKPPVPSAKDFKQLRGKGITQLSKWFCELTAKAEQLDEEIKKARAALVEAAEKENHPMLTAGGCVEMRKESRMGNVQYAKIPELKDVDLDKYRGNGSVYWKVVPKKKEKTDE